MIQMNLFTNRNRLTDLENELTVVVEAGVGSGGKWGRDSYGVWGGYLHTAIIKIITNNDLLYSIENSA